MIVFFCLTKYLSWWWMPFALVEPKDHVIFIELYWSDSVELLLNVIVVVVDFMHFLINNHMTDTLWPIKLCFIRTSWEVFSISCDVCAISCDIHSFLFVMYMFNILWCIFNILLYMFNILSCILNYYSLKQVYIVVILFDKLFKKK